MTPLTPQEQRLTDRLLREFPGASLTRCENKDEVYWAMGLVTMQGSTRWHIVRNESDIARVRRDIELSARLSEAYNAQF
jgi:hypothetical protein